jgi:adenylate cyclase
MAEEGFKRKLTAILSADVEGYSRLMDDDEEATIRTLTAYREAMTTLIQQYRGRVVDAPGDNLLAEFASAVDAVNCAVEIQRELAERNAELAYERRMQFRIGVNVGDVVEEEDRIYGDGVNIAARVEGLADAGGICISGRVYDQVENILDYSYEFLGEQKVKNISRLVRMYRVKLEADSSEIESSNELKILPLPDKPSIAVLPFVNMSGDPEQEYLSDGITEEIITGLSKIPKIFVIARNSTFTYKGKPVKVQNVSEELGVQYVLEGSVRKAGNRIRITAQLVDAIIGHHLWADRYDRDLGDIFALQDEITMKILTALQVKLTEGEQARLTARGTKNLQAFLKRLQGVSIYLRITKEDNALARQIFKDVISLDSEYAPAYSILGATYWMDVFLGSSKSPKKSLATAVELIQKAIALDDSYAEAHAQGGWLLTMMGKHEEAIAEIERAIELAPNSADAHMWMSFILRVSGRNEEAIQFAEQAIRLNPIPDSWYFRGLALNYMYAQRYDEAITTCKKGLNQAPNDLLTHVTCAAIYGKAGRKDAARAEAEEVLKRNPKFSAVSYAKRVPYKNQSDRDFFLDGMQKAGLPD